jgi:hypothetical protein
MIKTVLVPGAPWPKYEPPVERKEISPKSPKNPKSPKPKVTKPKSKIRRTNDNFDAWLASEKKKAKP